ncbi:hypothetical protein DM02DRAFT_688962 [Periconia macrospinosa]|uniref:Uncharacterized protein n=1 Tax=Periconia macrospinosa TaxID=97972 RepID=A0A2V1E4D9_9PLEO|nr:hypothetical protein DM02DRAFT_688962 [Periconia macrospinosa]
MNRTRLQDWLAACKAKVFQKRPNSPEEVERQMEPVLSRQIGVVQNSPDSTIGRSPTIKSKANSVIASLKADMKEKIYTGVVFGLPLPTPPHGSGHPHITNYSKDLVHFGRHTICRCGIPSIHGDAFTRRHHAEAVNKITFLSAPTPTAPSRPLTWEEAMIALLDAACVDVRASPGWHQEDQSLLRQVYAESTVKAIMKYREVWQGVIRIQGNVKCMLEDDVFWWSEKNPKGIKLKNLSHCGGGQPLSIHGPFYSQGSLKKAQPIPSNEETSEEIFYAL